MTPILPHDPETQSADLVASNIDALRTLFPEAFTEGRIDFDVLRQLLGSNVDDREEKYGLNWHGKRQARQLALTPSTGTLRPAPADSVDWDTTKNLMIEGDNLEVLKLLQKSYAGKVKMIYIDPPYNTGKDFVYPDNFQDNIKNYLELTGQTDEQGKKLSTNSEASGRFHTDWLNMIYPRLMLAKNLLSDQGLIFISIDDNEESRLMEICTQVFGGENYCGNFVWEKKKKPSFLDSKMGVVTEYVVAFAHSRALAPAFLSGEVEDGKGYPFNNAGNGLKTLTFPTGSVRFTCSDQKFRAQDMSEGNIKTTLLDSVLVKDGRNQNEFRLIGEWRYSQSTLNSFIAAGDEIYISKAPFRPNYVNRSGTGKKTANLLSHRTNGVPTNEDATGELRDYFGSDVFDHPKPTGLLTYLIRAVTQAEDLIVDFFAGSGTTADACWKQNLVDGASRQSISVQLPENLNFENSEEEAHNGTELLRALGKPLNIAELTKERLRRAAAKIKSENPLFHGDLGFRVFKLDSTNLRPWEPNRDKLSETLEESVEHIKAGRSEQDILYEVLLKLGLELTVPIETRTLAGKTVYRVGSGELLVCLAETIAAAEVEPLALAIVDWAKSIREEANTVAVFRDSAFADDIAKTNLTAILNQHGLTNVRSL